MSYNETAYVKNEDHDTGVMQISKRNWSPMKHGPLVDGQGNPLPENKDNLMHFPKNPAFSCLFSSPIRDLLSYRTFIDKKRGVVVIVIESEFLALPGDSTTYVKPTIREIELCVNPSGGNTVLSPGGQRGVDASVRIFFGGHVIILAREKRNQFLNGEMTLRIRVHGEQSLDVKNKDSAEYLEFEISPFCARVRATRRRFFAWVEEKVEEAPRNPVYRLLRWAAKHLWGTVCGLILLTVCTWVLIKHGIPIPEMFRTN